MSERQTSDEALTVALKGAKMFFVRGGNWNKQANHVAAKNVIDTELGRYADTLPVYHLDEEKRDRLLVHARQDAAEALLHASSLMDEVRELRKTLNGIIWTVFFVVFGIILISWARSGFVIHPLW